MGSGRSLWPFSGVTQRVGVPVLLSWVLLPTSDLPAPEAGPKAGAGIATRAGLEAAAAIETAIEWAERCAIFRTAALCSRTGSAAQPVLGLVFKPWPFVRDLGGCHRSCHRMASASRSTASRSCSSDALA